MGLLPEHGRARRTAPVAPPGAGARGDSLHWRTAGGPVETYTPQRPVLVLVPDLSLDGGVTHYYRTLRLDRLDNIDYFFVNKPATRTRFDKTLHALGIFATFALRVRRYSLIHVNPSLNPNSFYRDWFFIAVARLTGRKVLVFFRGWDETFEARISASPLLSRLFRWTYGRADRVVTLGDVFRRRLAALGLQPRTPVHVDTTVAGPARPGEYDAAEAVRASEAVINCLFLSRIIADKGVFTAIDAVAQCNQALGRIAIHLVVAGDGPDRDAAARHAGERRWASVELAGEVRGRAKSVLMRRSRVLLFPTRHGEGLPNSVLEAMLAGMVIVTRDAGSIPEIVETGSNGLVTSSTDPAVFAEYLLRLVNEPSLVAGIAARNREVAAAFTTGNVRKRLLNIYRLTLAADGGGP